MRIVHIGHAIVNEIVSLDMRACSQSIISAVEYSFFSFQFPFPFPSIPFHWCGGYVHVHPLGVSLCCGGCVFYTFKRNLFGLRQSEVMFTSFIFQLLEDIPTISLVQFTLYSPTLWFGFEQHFERFFNRLQCHYWYREIFEFNVKENFVSN